MSREKYKFSSGSTKGEDEINRRQQKKQYDRNEYGVQTNAHSLQASSHSIPRFIVPLRRKVIMKLKIYIQSWCIINHSLPVLMN